MEAVAAERMVLETERAEGRVGLVPGLAGLAAPTEVFPRIAGWFAERSTA
jgi:hypothetical protein